MASAPNGASIQGVVDAGQPVAGFPVSMGFKDLTGNNQFATGDAAGNLNVSLGSVLPAAAVASDAFPNPTTTQVESFPFVWNGTTWDRWKDMAAAQAQTTFTGVPATAPFYLDTTGTPSIRRAVTAASITGSVTGTQIPASANAIWDGAAFRPQLGDTSGRSVVTGAAVAGAAVAGNPLSLGGRDATGNSQFVGGNNTGLFVQGGLTAGTAASGQNPVQMGAADTSLNVQVVRSQPASSDGLTSGVNGLSAVAFQYAFNGTSYDRQRLNTDVTFLASAARTTTQGPTNITTYNARAIYLVLDMTNVAAGPSVTLKVDMIDPASGKAINLLTGAAVVAATTNIYKIGVGLTPAANLVVNEYLPRTIAVTITANNANSGTYSVGYSLIAA